MRMCGDSILTSEAQEFLKEWRSEADTVVAYTSGSTGKPKRIELRKTDMEASATATVRFFGITADSTLFLPLSPDYIAGKMQIVRAEVAGCKLVVVPPSSTDFGTTGEVIDMLPIVPSQLHGLLASDTVKMVRNVIIGGAPLSATEELLAAEASFNAWATYGMTETCSHVALRRIGEELYYGLPGYSFSTDNRGCLVIDNADMSFGRLITNDVVDLQSSSTFRWVGRADNVINSGGVKIHPEEIERVIAQLLPVGCSFYVTARPSELWGSEAVIVTDSTVVNDTILTRLRTILSGKLVPKAIIYLPELPRTASGKIIRERMLNS